MSKTLSLAAAAGLALVVALIAWQGFGAVAEAFTSAGAGAGIVVLLRVVQVAGAGLAWRVLLPASAVVSLTTCVLLRWVREAINTLLPVAQVGGDLIGARLLKRPSIDGGLAGASILVDLLTQTATQVVFSLAGLAVLIAHGRGDGLVHIIGGGLVLMSVATFGFFAAQRFGGFHLVERGLIKLAETPAWSKLASVKNLHDSLQALHDDNGRMAASFLIHLVIWFVGVLEIYVALDYMGYPVGLGPALVIESLGHAARAAGFLIPGALGVQEGGFIALCALYGIPAPAAIALSLVKRVPEIVLGLPGLVYWHRLEARRPRESAAAEAQPESTP